MSGVHIEAYPALVAVVPFPLQGEVIAEEFGMIGLAPVASASVPCSAGVADS